MERIDILKSKAKKIKVQAGEKISDVLHMLEDMHAENQNVFVEVNGHTVYSIDIDYNKSFKEIVGMTPEEYDNLLEEARKKDLEIKASLAKDAKVNYQNRINRGKKEIRREKHGLWENFVKENSKEPYFTKEIDIVIEYLNYLNNDLDIEEIAAIFKERFQTIGDWYTSTILSNIAKFHPRGIELFEYLRNEHKRNGHKVADSGEYMKKLRNINILLDMGESINDAIALTNNSLATITIDGIEHLALINENTNLMSRKDDYMLVGQFFDEFNHIIFAIDGTKVNYYLTVNGETAEIYIDGRLGDITKDKIEVTKMIANIEDIAEEYYVAYNGYANLDVETLLKVLKSIRELTNPSKEVVGEMVLHDEMRRLKTQVIKLTKGTN